MIEQSEVIYLIIEVHLRVLEGCARAERAVRQTCPSWGENSKK